MNLFKLLYLKLIKVKSNIYNTEVKMIKNFMKALISKKARQELRKYLKEKQVMNMKLFMTIVIRDEDSIIEKNIRFHKAMGVDGFIVTSHNSTDRTNEILNKLKQEGFVLDILYKNSPNHQHHVWVDEMIKIAKKKYKADWIINADADEFYYSKDLNLKKSIWSYKKINPNVLTVDSTYLFPDNRDDFINCPYFVTKPFQDFEANMLNIIQDDTFKPFIGTKSCIKVIHKTKGYRKIYDGNHSIKMFRRKQLYATNIVLYHYHIKNYKEYERKILRWLDSAHLMPKGMGEHMKKMIMIYKENKLREHYNNQYGENIRNFLINEGVVSIDKSVSNFVKWKDINNKYD